MPILFGRLASRHAIAALPTGTSRSSKRLLASFAPFRLSLCKGHLYLRSRQCARCKRLRRCLHPRADGGRSSRHCRGRVAAVVRLPCGLAAVQVRARRSAAPRVSTALMSHGELSSKCWVS